MASNMLKVGWKIVMFENVFSVLFRYIMNVFNKFGKIGLLPDQKQ